MRFSIATVLAFATAALAQVDGFHPITKPTKGEKVPAGSTYEIVWGKGAAGHTGTISIGLLGGSSPGTLSVIDTIASGVDGDKGSFSWQVGAGLGNLATYGIMITLESDKTIFQYGFPFQIVGGSGSSTSTTASATGSTTGTGSVTTTGSSTTPSATSTQSDTSTSSSTSFSVPASIASSTARSNLTTTSRGSGGQTTITSVVVPTGPTTTTGTTTIATNGVASVAAGSFALFGGVAMAVLAL